VARKHCLELVHGELLIKPLKRLKTILLKRDLSLFGEERDEPGPFSPQCSSVVSADGARGRGWESPVCPLFSFCLGWGCPLPRRFDSGGSVHRAQQGSWLPWLCRPPPRSCWDEGVTLHFELLLQTRVIVCSNFFATEASFGIRPGRVLSVNQEIV